MQLIYFRWESQPQSTMQWPLPLQSLTQELHFSATSLLHLEKSDEEAQAFSVMLVWAFAESESAAKAAANATRSLGDIIMNLTAWSYLPIESEWIDSRKLVDAQSNTMSLPLDPGDVAESLYHGVCAKQPAEKCPGSRSLRSVNGLCCTPGGRSLKTELSWHRWQGRANKQPCR